MSAATIDQPKQVNDVNKLVSIDDWEAERALRAEARAKKRPVLQECLDYEVAAEYESKKPTFQFKVECTYFLPDEDTGRPIKKTDAMTVRAQNEKDAWAIFCDRLRHWPSQHACEKTITKLKAA